MNSQLSPGVLDALKAVWKGVACSRSDVARITGVSRPTASAIVGTLLEDKILAERGCGRSSGGKPPIHLGVNPDAFHTVGIDIGYDDAVCALRLDFAGNVTGKVEIPSSGSYLCRRNAAAEAVFKLKTPQTVGVGVAVSGIVDPSCSRVIECANFDFAGKPLVSELEEMLDMPVFIDNRARMAARAEQFSGAASGVDDFILVSLGKGLGCAFGFSGRLYCGKSGRAGELRGMIVPRYGGGFMDFESALSEKILAENGYPYAEAAGICAAGLKQLVSLTDPGLLILAGRFSDFPQLFFDCLKKELAGVDICL